MELKKNDKVRVRIDRAGPPHLPPHGSIDATVWNDGLHEVDVVVDLRDDETSEVLDAAFHEVGLSDEDVALDAVWWSFDRGNLLRNVQTSQCTLIERLATRPAPPQYVAVWSFDRGDEEAGEPRATEAECLADLLKVLREAAEYVDDLTHANDLLRALTVPGYVRFYWRIQETD